MNKYALLAQAITDQLTMPDLIAKYTPHTPRNDRIPCPLHGGESYNMHFVDYGYYCWVCGEKGGVIQFVQAMFNLSFQDAVIKLNDDFGLNLPINRRLTLREQRQAEQRRAEVMRQRAEQDAKKQAYDRLYWSLWDEWIRLDINSRQHDWTDPTEPPSDEYVEAVKMLCVAEYRINSEL